MHEENNINVKGNVDLFIERNVLYEAVSFPAHQKYPTVSSYLKFYCNFVEHLKLSLPK